jgi:hypothetical protein
MPSCGLKLSDDKSDSMKASDAKSDLHATRNEYEAK